MNGQQDTDKDAQDIGRLPANWYGQNYLGRPVNVAVTGESPTQGGGTSPLTGMGASAPTGALGAPAATPNAAPAEAASSGASGADGGLTGTHKALAALGLTQQGAKLGSIAGHAATLVGPEGIPIQTDPSTGFAAMEVNIDPNTGAALPGKGILPSGIEGSHEAGLSGGDIASGAMSAAAIARILAGLVGAHVPASVDSSLSTGAAASSLAAMSPLSVFAVPAAINSWAHTLKGPPTEPFPLGTWDQFSTAVQYNLPPRLPVPDGATPEQRASIETANSTIEAMTRGMTGELPSYLQGRQNPTVWNWGVGDLSNQATTAFTRLQEQYQPALDAVSQLGGLTPELVTALTTKPEDKMFQEYTRRVRAYYRQAHDLLSGPMEEGQTGAQALQQIPGDRILQALTGVLRQPGIANPDLTNQWFQESGLAGKYD